MKNLLSLETYKKMFSWALAHKIISAVAVVAVLGGGYFVYGKMTADSGETRYILGTVEKGTIVSSISASGQVSASNQVEIQPKASGEIIYVGVKEGQTVKNGAVIAQIDAKTAQKSVRDAQANLESAQIALEKLKKPADSLSLTQAENALAKANESKQDAQTDLQKAYDNGFNDISNAFLDLPTVMAGLEDILYGSDGNSGQDNISFYGDAIKSTNDNAMKFKDDAAAKYSAARIAYDKNFSDFKSASRTSDAATIEALINQTYDTSKAIADAVKSANNLIQLYQDEYTRRHFTPVAFSTTALTDLGTYTGTTNSHVSSLLSSKSTIKTSRDTIVNADRSITENTESLNKLKAGTDSLDLRSSELSVVKAENALQDAQNTLADYYIRAPFDGVVASLDIQKGQTVGSAAVATLITNQKVATLSVNEVDAAQIKVGDKATLSFDAIEDLTLTGEVAAIDTIGTVTQGVVSYELKVVFDSQDERIKSGMTANAAIQTDTKQDVLVVPSSAVKTQNGVSYVQVFDPPLSQTGGTQGVTSPIAPRQLEVVTGIADDTNVEIVSGLAQGQQIVTRTISGTAASAAPAAGNATRGGNAGFGGGPPGGGAGILIPR